MCTDSLGEATYRFVELHLLLQVQADDAVVVIDAVTMEVIHLSYNQNRDVSQPPPQDVKQHLALCWVTTHHQLI